MCGIQSQIQRDYETNGGMVSPQNKSLQSLHGIVKTKSAKDDELDKLHCHEDEDEDDGYIGTLANSFDDGMPRIDEKLSLSSPPSKPYTGRLSSSEYGKKKAGVDKEDEQEEDEGVFSLEL